MKKKKHRKIICGESTKNIHISIDINLSHQSLVQNESQDNKF